MQIAKQSYAEERDHVSVLFPIDAVPGLTPFASNNLGVAAFDNDGTSDHSPRVAYQFSQK
jgi:hypothetical protein